jgi:anti-sigma B factor antagonist
MELKIYRSEHNVYVEISGRIVLDECERVKNSVVTLIDKGVTQVYLDFSQVDFIDSAGLGVLVGFKMTANKNKSRLIIVSPSQNFSDILSVSKLDSIFDIIDGAEAELLKASIALPANIYTPPAEGEEAEEQPIQFNLKGIQTPQPESEESPAEEPLRLQIAGSQSHTPIPTTLKSDQEMIDEHCREAVSCIRAGEYDKAVNEYLKSLQIDPEYLPAHNNLAIVYEKKPSWHTKAIEQWEKVLEISQKRGDQKHIDRSRKHLANLKKLI